MQKPKKEKLGQILIRNRIITEDQLEEALAKQRESGDSLGRVLIDLKMVSEGALTSILARQIGLKYIDLANYDIDISASSLVDAEVARRYTLLPIGFEGDRLLIAMADPTNVFALDDVRIMTGMEIEPLVATKEDIVAAISRFCRAEADSELSVEDISEEIGDDGREADADDAPIVKYVNLLITEAVADRASDVHIEPMDKDVRVRFRIDGVLHEIRRNPRQLHPGVVARIKVMADMNIAEKRVPQDGRASVEMRGKSVDIRVASLPTIHGEKMVLRILDKSASLMSLEELGFREQTMEAYSRSFRKPYGTIMVTGPTGSGKTTTLYATLNVLNSIKHNIITVEDPVEYRLPLINQVQVHYKAGLTFASALRSILRCDPDIVMIGEIRDPESAQIAIESALTGHLVLSTLHTNDAPSALTRLLEMGIEPFLIASAVDCVSSQRLTRKLCARCKEPYEPDPDFLEKVGFTWEDMEEKVLFRSKGCAACNKTGFKGRIGVYEVLEVSENIEKLVARNAPHVEIAEMARSEGMRTMREEGFAKARQGVTSLEEVLRVIM
ncbi:MAG: type IV-A pilus assembly ATPase PilB [Candidatus Solincola sediminis]|uniref:Type IV-A pilus assembly ATPase PilB n=1 Tax=Candidatus Solincola sediminis TaxID=1797199 RepID=A0A1F2WFL9_9ACTN|nr:MAG: type IV-A pilus assembly ATPase PilB [Candidatus Solincola sediminis]OFW58077.1 MAG: type IV-A pilus assembly ATPase PilB [Candidatus Solincola sediminis]